MQTRTTHPLDLGLTALLVEQIKTFTEEELDIAWRESVVLPDDRDCLDMLGAAVAGCPGRGVKLFGELFVLYLQHPGKHHTFCLYTKPAQLWATARDESFTSAWWRMYLIALLYRM